MSKTVLITGGHKGLGLEATQRIAASQNYDLIVAGRNLSEIEAAGRQIRESSTAHIHPLHLDVSSLASVRNAAEAVRKMVADGEVAPLEVLMCNAGAQFLGDIQYSVDGYEQTFATNYLGHFLLVNLLLNDIQPGGRIVFTVSGTHDPDTMDGRMAGQAIEPDAFSLANEGKHGNPHAGGIRYATSKLCMILLAYELDRRMKAKGTNIASIAFDPGSIAETGLLRSAPPLVQRLVRTQIMTGLFKMLGLTMGSLTFSGGALADIAISPNFARASGKYIQSKNGQLVEARSSKASYDPLSARKLWMDTEKLVQLDSLDMPVLSVKHP